MFELIKKIFTRTNKIVVSNLQNEDKDVIMQSYPPVNVFIQHTNFGGMISDVCYSCELYEVCRAKMFVNAQAEFGNNRVARRIVEKTHMSMFFNGRPLADKPIPVHEYGIKEGSVVTIQFFGGLGGAKENILLPTYSHVQECEKEVVNTWTLQSSMFEPFFVKHRDDSTSEYAIKLCEDVAILGYHLMRAQSKTDYAIASLNFIKLRHKESFVKSLLLTELPILCEDLYSVIWAKQSSDIFTDSLKTARGLLDDYDSFKKGPLVARLYKLSMYCLANELFDGVGLTMSKLQFSRLSQEAIKREYHLGPSFVHCLLDTMLFICEQGVQCVKLGSIEPLVHGAKSYQEWFDSAMELKVKSKCLANPAPHGFTKFDFLKDLSSALEKGDAISRFAMQIGTNEKKLVRAMMNDLRMIQADCVTKEAAKRTRKAPFAILVYAGSSVGKSTFTDILFTYHGKIANLPSGSDYRYAVNFADEYESGFSTNQWCWLLDDIAFQHPNAAQGVDPSLMNVIQANNNVPYITNQADLPDKGRIPMWCEQVIGTTNVKHLNAYYYFTNPLAVQRRFPFVVELTPKPEFAKDGCMLDGQRVPSPSPNAYPDWWHIKVDRVIPRAGCPISNQTADYETVLETDNITDFLKWYYLTWTLYDEQQNKVIAGNAKFDDITLCKCHFVPMGMCPDELNFVQQATDMGRFDRRADYEFAVDSPRSDDWVEPQGPSRLQFGSTLQAIARERQNLLQTQDSEGEDLSHLKSDTNYDVDIDAAVDEVINSTSEDPLPEPQLTLEAYGHHCSQRIYSDIALDAAWERGWLAYFSAQFGMLLLYCFTEYKLFRMFVGKLYSFPMTRNWLWMLIMCYTRDSRVFMHMFAFMGEKAQKKIGKVPFLVSLAGILTTGIATYKLASWLFSGKEYEVQATRKEGVKPSPLDEKGENVWYKDTFVLTEFDVPVASKSLVGKDEVALRVIAKGLVKLRCFLDENTARDQTLISLGGQYYLANNHGIPELDNMRVHYVQAPQEVGVSSNMEIRLSQSQIKRYPEHDLCVIHIPNVPPKASLRKFFPEERIGGVFKGTIVNRDYQGKLEYITASVVKGMTQYWPVFEQTFFAWMCKVKTPTRNGQCGSPLVAFTGKGPVILGIHTLGDSGNAAVSREVTGSMLDQFLQKEIVIESGAPVLSTPSIEMELQSLNAKSVFRYLESGTAQVYGSFAGWRSSMRSRVAKSVLCEEVCKKFDYTLKHGAPVMKGWQPWRIAAQDMVQPTVKIDQTILNKCVDAFTSDILSGLPESELKLLEVYDTQTSINGAPGIKFVNKIPRNTSMGFPWKKSKKHYLVDDRSDDLPDGMTFMPEVMDRVSQIEETYSQGKRFFPVFTAHLKDEATKFKKIDAKKTRVFTGAPVDWSIVVRKYFLSFVRVLQRNKLIFEAGPGTNPQSAEWQQLGEYLMQHGKDRMIAGDYAAFDKSMPPAIILAAFQIISNICEAAGFDLDDLRTMKCIAFDTAFPVVDFNGDLIQFFGSNPSGHPLTVIINGLANSLYMRYCFYNVNPRKECVTFRKYVALLTYGDDNVMGVSNKAPWFNHTAIQDVLARVGITYTMADKEAESVPYINMDDISFLKRSWRYDNDVGFLLAPLEEDSIFKMLTVNVRSDTVCAEAQAIATVESALNEWFFFGREVFESRRSALIDIVRKCDLEDYVEKSTFPTWDALKVRFYDNSKDFIDDA